MRILRTESRMEALLAEYLEDGKRKGLQESSIHLHDKTGTQWEYILLLRQIKERSDRVKAVWPFFFDWVQAVVLVFKEMNKRWFFMRMVGEIQIKYFGWVTFPIVNSLYFPWQFCCHAAAVFNSSQIALHLQNVKPRVWGAESPSSFARIKNPQSGGIFKKEKRVKS